MTKEIAIKIGKIDDILGYLLVAATSTSLCYIGLSDSQAKAQADMTRYFHRAKSRGFGGLAVTQPSPPPRILEEGFAAIADLCYGRMPLRLPPFEAWGTPFQQKVWAELLTIKRGETRTYQEVAAKLGCRSFRAVGGRWAATPWAS